MTKRGCRPAFVLLLDVRPLQWLSLSLSELDEPYSGGVVKGEEVLIGSVGDPRVEALGLRGPTGRRSAGGGCERLVFMRRTGFGGMVCWFQW